MAAHDRTRVSRLNETLLPPANELAPVSVTTLAETQLLPHAAATIPAPPPSSTDEAPFSVLRTLRSPPPAACDDEPPTDRQPISTLPPAR